MKIISFFVFVFIFIPYIFSQILIDGIKDHPGFQKELYPFFHGVASGDADSESVVIWTRVTPKIQMRSIDVKWFISTDSLLKNVIDSGFFRTYPERDYTVKILVKHLNSNKIYYYKFYALGKYSVTGITRTLPATKDKVENLRPVFFTGSNYNAGFFNAYASVTKRNDISVVVHLGDYFYEYGENIYGKNKKRNLYPKHKCINLADYRERLSHYRLDPDLREAHRKYCWYVIWDDHESANNSWAEGAQDHQINEGDWKQRKTDAKQAYFEWLPIRDNNDNSIFGTYSAGKLARFILLDTRLEGRDKQSICPADSNKTMLGKKQLSWLFNELRKAQKDSVNWIFITQQVMFAPLMIGKKVVNNDQWDGYQAERKKIIDFIVENNMKNVVIISGDVHTSWANEIYTNKKIKRKDFTIPEFIPPSITSHSMGKITGTISQVLIRIMFQHVRYVDMHRKGYMILDIKPKTVTAEWYYLKTIKEPNTKITEIKKYQIDKTVTKRIKKLNIKH